METELTKDEHAWLVEYQACQQESDSNSSNFWTLASIFIGFSSALLGVLLYGMLANIDTITKIIGGDAWTLGIIITVVGLGMVSILIFLWFWLKRTQYLMDRNYERMREIEDELGMWKNWYAYIPDKLKSHEVEDDELGKLLPKEKANKIRQLVKRYASPAGFSGLKWITILLMIGWGFLIIREFINVYYPNYYQNSIDIIHSWFY